MSEKKQVRPEFIELVQASIWRNKLFIQMWKRNLKEEQAELKKNEKILKEFGVAQDKTTFDEEAKRLGVPKDALIQAELDMIGEDGR